MRLNAHNVTNSLLWYHSLFNRSYSRDPYGSCLEDIPYSCLPMVINPLSSHLKTLRRPTSSVRTLLVSFKDGVVEMTQVPFHQAEVVQ